MIEDDPFSMKLELDLLQLSGFDVVGFTDGESALEALKGATPDLILLDIGLPGIDGYEIQKKMKQDKRLSGIKIAALSASVMKEDQEKIRAAGFDIFMPKPIDTKALVMKIREIL
ncbi:MAG: response regulator [Candidatus Omnitrophica bacterium]|nr:response regulator [Candidatus Omnitrophota bacterium]MDD5436006.1 response regulator [Candidatus Omnitrophota bacterium]